MNTILPHKVVVPGVRDSDSNQSSQTKASKGNKFRNCVGYALRKMASLRKRTTATPISGPDVNINKSLEPTKAKTQRAYDELIMNRDTLVEAETIADAFLRNKYEALRDEMQKVVEEVRVETANDTNNQKVSADINSKLQNVINRVVKQSMLKTKSASDKTQSSEKHAKATSHKESSNQGDDGPRISDTEEIKDYEEDSAMHAGDDKDLSTDSNGNDTLNNEARALTNDILQTIVKELANTLTTKSSVSDSSEKQARRALNAIKVSMVNNISKIIMDNKLADTMQPTDPIATSTGIQADACCLTSDVDESTQKESVEFSMGRYFNLQSVRHAFRDKKWVKFNEKLTHFLRIKFFMRPRDYHLLNQMILDARNYLIKNDHTVDNASDYLLLTTSVSAAFAITEEEIECRESIKSMINIDPMRKINQLSAGNLGRIPHRGLKQFITAEARRAVNSSKKVVTFDHLPTISA